MKRITNFRNEFFFLSNMYPCKVEYDGIIFNSSEQAYQYAKAVTTEDKDYILNAKTPMDSKKRGRKIHKRADWDDVKLKVMVEVVWNKFTTNSDCKEALLLTKGYELIEENWWKDTYWGKYKGQGENYLGRILMYVRKKLESFDDDK